MKLNSSFAKRCGIALLAGLCQLLLHVEASPKYSSWSAPTNLGPVVNSLFEESLSAISKDGLSLFFSSTRPGFGNDDIWVSQRARSDAAWGAPLNLGLAINTSFRERTPTLSRDEHYLFFVTNRSGGFGGLDLWVSWRPHTQDNFGWQPPVNLGPGVNSSLNDAGPALFEGDDNSLTLYFASNRPGGIGSYDIYQSAFTEAGVFASAVLVPSLSSPQSELRPAIRNDGLEIFVSSDRMGSVGGADIWVSRRTTVSDSWSPPENAGALVNTVFMEMFPTLSSDAQTLLFVSNRPDPAASGDLDLYAASRSKLGKP